MAGQDQTRLLHALPDLFNFLEPDHRQQVLKELEKRWARSIDDSLTAALGSESFEVSHPKFSSQIKSRIAQSEDVAMREALQSIHNGRKPQTQKGWKRYRQITAIPLRHLIFIRLTAQPWFASLKNWFN